MNTTTSTLPLATQQRLLELQRKVRLIKLAEGVLAGLFGLIVSYILVFVLDRFMDTPAILRGLILLTGALGVGLFLPMVCHRWIWGTRHMEQVAKIIRRKFPSLGDQILGVIELAKDPESLKTGSALARAAIAQVDQVIQKRDLTPAIPKPRYQQWAVAAAIPLGMAVIAMFAVPSAGWNAMARWLTPWRNVDRYTFAQIDQLPEKIVVPHGEDFGVNAHLADSTEWTPGQGTVRVNTLRESIRTPVAGKDYAFTIPARTEDSKLYVSIGDVRETIRIVPTTRPEVVALHASVKLPDYLQIQEPLISDVRGGAISIVKGATANFDAQINRDLASAEVDGKSALIHGSQISHKDLTVNDSQILRFRWIDSLGLSGKDEYKLKVQAIDDNAPIITCQQANPLPVILTTDVVRFELASKDDFGLKQIGLEWSAMTETAEEPQVLGFKIVMPGSPKQSDLSTQATFSATSDNVAPQRLQIRAFAQDYLPGRPRSYSPAYVVHIMTPDDHVIWMTEQLRRWMANADDVYEQEVRLHNINRQIRDMDEATLALPATQRQIEQQIAAERANAARLGAVTSQGSQLLAQAMRNPEMNADQLEAWAQVLNELNGISNDKMPSIADLLRQGIAGRGQSSTPGSGVGAPTAGNNKGTMAAKPGAPTKPSKQPNGPTLADIESGFNKPDESKEDGEKKPVKATPSVLEPPSTILMGGPSKKSGGGGDSPDELDEAIEDQTELLAEFARLRDQMQKIMDQLENSTFVKRFKSASRKQMEIATDLNRTLTKGFGQRTIGLNESQSKVLAMAKEREVKQSDFVSDVQSDLDAYAGRKKETKLLKVLEEMREMEVISELKIVGTQIERNYTGEAIASAEFWADTLDRWAEEMVPPGKESKSKPGKSNNLPPWAVLEILRLLEGEMNLRDETRSLEKARPAIENEEYLNRLDAQVKTQTELSRRAKVLVDDIKKLPEGEAKFGKAIGLVTAAHTIMDEVVTILETPETGAPAIAAETEIIELLLQAKRVNPKGGGGSSGDTAGGGGSGTTDVSALALHGEGANENAKPDDRAVQQTSGATTKMLPEEFRSGLDAFFNAMDKK